MWGYIEQWPLTSVTSALFSHDWFDWHTGTSVTACCSHQPISRWLRSIRHWLKFIVLTLYSCKNFGRYNLWWNTVNISPTEVSDTPALWRDILVHVLVYFVFIRQIKKYVLGDRLGPDHPWLITEYLRCEHKPRRDSSRLQYCWWQKTSRKQ